MDALTEKSFGNVEVSTGAKGDDEVFKAYGVVVCRIIQVF
jgi:hypothetical protein